MGRAVERSRLRSLQGGKYYYVPGFAEPGPGLEIIVNRERWRELGPDLQTIVATAASAAANETYADFHFHNVQSFRSLVAERGVELRTFPEEVWLALGRTTLEVFEEISARDELTRKVHRSFFAFLKLADDYASQFDARFLAMRRRVLAGA